VIEICLGFLGTAKPSILALVYENQHICISIVMLPQKIDWEATLRGRKKAGKFIPAA
jgi:hypothetical protein